MHHSCAVITVAYDSDDVLPALLASAVPAGADPALVVVADNLPGASTEAIAASAGARYLPLPENGGYGAAVNSARRLLGDGVDWLLVCNPDLTLAPGMLDRLIETASADRMIGSAGPAILTPEGDVYPSARAVPSIGTGIGHALFANVWKSNPWSAAYHSNEVARRDAGWLSGACVLVRVSAFDEIGGFDERYFMYFEDVDLGYRLGRAGYRNVYEPEASATHIGAVSTQRDPARAARMRSAHHESARRFLDTKYSAPWFLPLRLAWGVALRIRARFTHSEAARAGHIG